MSMSHVSICALLTYFFACVVVLFYFLNKEGRARVIFHGPEPEVPNSLASYGILRDHIPAHMGGTLAYDPTLWIMNRRAVELELEEL